MVCVWDIALGVAFGLIIFAFIIWILAMLFGALWNGGSC